ncbi:MAG TPA: hypothetical protein VGG85_09475 [Terracidiphilus sp.]|jgi:hypothetical protein
MTLKTAHWHRVLLLLVCAGSVASLVPNAKAASCKTESQMTAPERDALMSAAKNLIGDVQSGNVQALQTSTIPAVAADFSGIANTAQTLKPMVERATVTIYNLYSLDASTEAAGAARTDFYCGTPVVVLNFNGLPPGTYALAIVHATGVPQPQQIALILSKNNNRWMLAGFFSKPMTDAGHDGIWYWTSARHFAQKQMKWDAWFYYRLASNLLNPVDFLTSANLEKLQHETDQVRPDNLPGTKSLLLNANGSSYEVTTIDTSSALGALDLEIHYNPSAAQVSQLRDPPSARKQVLDVMTSILALHPEVHEAFHGIWVHADQGDASVFSLELPMDQIAAIPPPATTSGSLAK